MRSGLEAERLGVCVGWKIIKINGQPMPSYNGCADEIHKQIGEAKSLARTVAVTFELPSADEVVVGYIQVEHILPTAPPLGQDADEVVVE